MGDAPTDDHQPPFDRAAEVERLLAADETVLGRVWQYRQEGLTPQEMSEREGVSSAHFLSRYDDLIAVLRDGRISNSPTGAIYGAQRVRSWLRRKPLSAELRAELAEQEELLMSRANDKEAQAAEVEGAVQATKAAEAVGTPGIYVYTLPHYLRYPYDPDTGRTLLKVGHSAVDAYYRAGAQGRLTALPEDPILLRIYPAAESAYAERQFHAWLRDADHAGGRTSRGGSEWFITSTKFLDRIARSAGLEVRVINEFEAGDE